jgi:hypothetical protein
VKLAAQITGHHEKALTQTAPSSRGQPFWIPTTLTILFPTLGSNSALPVDWARPTRLSLGDPAQAPEDPHAERPRWVPDAREGCSNLLAQRLPLPLRRPGARRRGPAQSADWRTPLDSAVPKLWRCRFRGRRCPVHSGATGNSSPNSKYPRAPSL